MHEKALPKRSKDLLKKMEASSDAALNGWTLAGGTGLALELGHRVSEDFDFFRTMEFEMRALHDTIKKFGSYETLQEDKDTLTVMMSGIKMSFFRVADPFIFKSTPYSFFELANILDIALMKLVAISGRGSRKDFVDLYSILRRGHNLKDLFDAIPRKYSKGRANTYHILKSLTYFDDAEKEPLPKMLEPFDWKECKNFLIRQAHAIVLPSE